MYTTKHLVALRSYDIPAGPLGPVPLPNLIYPGAPRACQMPQHSRGSFPGLNTSRRGMPDPP